MYFPPPFRADYQEPAFQWPPFFMVVSGKSHQRDRIGGAQISCVSHLSKPLFQPNTKGEAWLNPFYFLVWFLCVCVCAQPHPYISLPTHTSAWVCFYVCWSVGMSLNGVVGVFRAHLVFPLAHQCTVSSTSSPEEGPV